MSNCLNPFMNQVYLYQGLDAWIASRAIGLNPFMNQVYLYVTALGGGISKDAKSLNPFMNQVYLYMANNSWDRAGFEAVLIPL